MSSMKTLTVLALAAAAYLQCVSSASSTSYTCSSDGFHADPDSCNGYYICQGNFSVHINCAAGLRFDPKLNYCDFARNVPCGSQPPVTTALPHPVTTRSTTRRPTMAPTHAPINTAAPTQAPVTTNPLNTAFPGTNAPLQTAKPTIGPVVITTGAAGTNGPQTFAPLQTPVPTIGNPVVTNVPVGTTFPPTYAPIQTHAPGPATNTPFSPIIVPVLGLVTSKPPPAQTNAPASGVGMDSMFCQSKANGLFADPKNCGYYYQCDYGQSFHEPCPPRLVFNQNVGACDYAVNVPSCVRRG